MKPEAQRIAIAKACGWKLEQARTDASLGEPSWILTRPDGGLVGERSWIGLQKNLPDYLNDLNAMNEVETILTEEQQYIYSEQIAGISARNYQKFLFRLTHASAEVRAEAFLKTLGLWKDE